MQSTLSVNTFIYDTKGEYYYNVCTAYLRVKYNIENNFKLVTKTVLFLKSMNNNVKNVAACLELEICLIWININKNYIILIWTKLLQK